MTLVGIFWTNWYNRTLDYYYRMDLDCDVLIVGCVSSMSVLSAVFCWPKYSMKNQNDRESKRKTGFE